MINEQFCDLEALGRCLDLLIGLNHARVEHRHPSTRCVRVTASGLLLNRCDQPNHDHTMNYPYAAWRRILFVAVLLVIIVIAFAPATTQGTLVLRFSSLSSPSVISHIYVGFTQIALHEVGSVNSSICGTCGWITISQSFPTVALMCNPLIPPTVTSSPIHS